MDKQPSTDPSVRTFHPSPHADLRLVCCPHAGASAGACTALSAALPEQVEAVCVQYPGRHADRGRTDAGITDIPRLADRIAAAVLPLADRPLAVIGHSMGAAVAFEVTRCLEASGVRPVRLFVSGRRAPSQGLGVAPATDDEAIVRELEKLGGPSARLLAKPKFRASVVSAVRGDFRANSAYLAPPGAAVACPVTFLLADADPHLDAAAPEGWRAHTTGGFRSVTFPGGHFFVDEQLPAVVRELLADLAPVSAAARPDGSGEGAR